MALSKRSVERLIDLIEIKMSCMQVVDREDAREMAALDQCRRELERLAEQTGPTVVPFPKAQRKRHAGT